MAHVYRLDIAAQLPMHTDRKPYFWRTFQVIPYAADLERWVRNAVAQGEKYKADAPHLANCQSSLANLVWNDPQTGLT
jgi:hypothetical protein